jgi:large subunit ribosomal protein L13
MIIDAKDQTLGRMLSYAAKQALKGEQVAIINCEKALVSGKKERILNDNLAMMEIKNKGNYTRGPFHFKRPDRYVKKVLRGMFPYNKPRGVEAFKRVRVFIGTPELELKKHGIELKKEKTHELKHKKRFSDSVTVEEICRFIGGSW